MFALLIIILVVTALSAALCIFCFVQVRRKKLTLFYNLAETALCFAAVFIFVSLLDKSADFVYAGFDVIGALTFENNLERPFLFFLAALALAAAFVLQGSFTSYIYNKGRPFYVALAVFFKIAVPAAYLWLPLPLGYVLGSIHATGNAQLNNLLSLFPLLIGMTLLTRNFSFNDPSAFLSAEGIKSVGRKINS